MFLRILNRICLLSLNNIKFFSKILNLGKQILLKHSQFKESKFFDEIYCPTEFSCNITASPLFYKYSSRNK